MKEIIEEIDMLYHWSQKISKSSQKPLQEV